MGKKRKSEDSEEKIRRKIEKLQNKLQRYNHNDDSSSEAESNNNADAVDNELFVFPDVSFYDTPDHVFEHAFEHVSFTTPASQAAEEPRPPSPLLPRPPTPVQPRLPTPDQPRPPTPAQPLPSTPVQAVASTSTPLTETPTAKIPEDIPQVELDDDILQLLGDAPEPDTTFGKAIHNDIATRWQDIIKKGLNKEAKEKILKEYLIPSNCEPLVPPILNPEAKAALTEPSVKRDASLMHRQKQISIAVAALGQVMDILLKEKDPKLNELTHKAIKPLSDACRLLCDMHHGESKIRRKFVISTVNTSLKDTLINSNTDKFLFGDNMTDKLKAAKTVQRSGEALKVPQKPQYTKSNFSNRGRSNFRTLHQRPTGRLDAGRTQSGPRNTYAGGSAQTAPPPRRPRPRSPPPPQPPPPQTYRRMTRR